MTTLVIREAEHLDSGGIADIYNHYIRCSTATFEETPLSESDLESRVAKVQEASLPWLIARKSESEGSSLVGYCYARPYHDRSAYRFTVETSLYVSPHFLGRGVGTQLYRALLRDLKLRNLHTAIAGIALPNEASVRLHENLGFTKVGQLDRVGFKFNQWIDVGYWQILWDPKHSSPESTSASAAD